MRIPWKSLGKDPILVNIDELYVIVAPNLSQYYKHIHIYVHVHVPFIVYF